MLLYGCSPNGNIHNPSSGSAFIYYDNIKVDNESYRIFVINDVDYLQFDELNPARMATKYQYREYKVDEINNWKINELVFGCPLGPQFFFLVMFMLQILQSKSFVIYL